MLEIIVIGHQPNLNIFGFGWTKYPSRFKTHKFLFAFGYQYTYLMVMNLCMGDNLPYGLKYLGIKTFMFARKLTFIKKVSFSHERLFSKQIIIDIKILCVVNDIIEINLIVRM